ncbi:methyl-accepting chemotaxis protein [Thalassotalea euphylliae]|uniref:Methyl-accepting chemotaxis protein n=1 Tax=Thalassotalea euphylliae TaxID=1655234 RepID=A0A3E0TN25_9GAMM|nr:methyl-accepting chemotaxis protein [Thalassotalea euphylliae]REL25991.1 methyl-accepting chemotaxis protein [Thalassotalea euphylliae]
MNLSIKAKLMLLAGAAMLTMGVIFIVEVISTKNTVLQKEYENVGQSVRHSLQRGLQAQADTATQSAHIFYQQAQLDQLKQELGDEIKLLHQTLLSIYQASESKTLAKDRVYAFLNHYRWGDNRYAYSFDVDSIVYQTHALDPLLIGESAKDLTDNNGMYFGRDIVNSALTHDIGFTRYADLNPKSKQVEDKLAVAMLVKPLNIVISTDEYISNLQADKQASALAMILQARYGESGYFWVQDSQGVFLTHPNKALIGTSIANTQKIAEQIKNKQETFIDMPFTNPATNQPENKISYARKIFPDWGWVIATGTYETEIKSAQTQLTQATKTVFAEKTQQSIIMMVFVTLLTFASLIWFINKTITKLALLNDRIKSLSSGEADLTSRIAITNKDEIGAIASSINDFIVYLQNMLRELSASSNHITQNIDELSEQSERNHQALNLHANETEQVVTAITEMSATANSVAENASQSAHNTNYAEQEATEAKHLVNSTTASVEQLMMEIEQAAVNINTMNDNTQEIVNVLGVIGDIAAQTNLLALNAAIEAARAGEQGRGFAVVADEVRALASRTQASTEEIGQILTKVQTDASNAVSAMQATQASCQLASDNTAKVSSSLSTMTSAIVEINDLNSQIATAAEQQSVATEEVSQNMSNIRLVVTDLTQSGKQTVTNSQALAASNQQLAGSISQFRV